MDADATTASPAAAMRATCFFFNQRRRARLGRIRIERMKKANKDLMRMSRAFVSLGLAWKLNRQFYCAQFVSDVQLKYAMLLAELLGNHEGFY